MGRGRTPVLSSLDALALRPATTIASRPRRDATARLGRRLPRRGLHAPRPRVEHDHAAGARDRLLDRADRSCHVGRRDRHRDAGGLRFDRAGRRASARSSTTLHVREADARRRRAPTAAAQALGGQHEVPSAPCSLHEVDRGRITGEVGVEEDVGGLVEGAAGQLDVLSAQRRAQVHVHRAGGSRARSAPGGARRHHERASTSHARPAPATWLTVTVDPGSVSAATSRGSRSDAPLSASTRSASRTGTGSRLHDEPIAGGKGRIRVRADDVGYAVGLDREVDPASEIQQVAALDLRAHRRHARRPRSDLRLGDQLDGLGVRRGDRGMPASDDGDPSDGLRDHTA